MIRLSSVLAVIGTALAFVAVELEALAAALEGVGPAMSDQTAEKDYMGTLDDDERCHRCGGENVRWSAPSPLWNRVMRGNDIDGEPRYRDLVCIRCFIVLAYEEGIDGTWRVSVDPEPDGLIYETPSGRIWDRSRSLWVDPPEPGAEPHITLNRGDMERLVALLRRNADKHDMPDQMRAGYDLVVEVLAQLAEASPDLYGPDGCPHVPTLLGLLGAAADLAAEWITACPSPMQHTRCKGARLRDALALSEIPSSPGQGGA